MDNFRPIETERLTIRSFRNEDLQDVYARVSDPQVTRYTGAVLTFDETKALLEERVLSESSGALLGTRAIILNSTQRNIGYCGLNELPSLAGNPIELSYGLTRDFWGYGFATEAAMAMLDYAFTILALDEVVAAVHPRNQASLNVARKLKFQFHGKVDWPQQGLVNLHRLSKARHAQQRAPALIVGRSSC
jgi:[ribosomal protein S5]-alanine N-acetyltransferase